MAVQFPAEKARSQGSNPHSRMGASMRMSLRAVPQTEKVCELIETRLHTPLVSGFGARGEYEPIPLSRMFRNSTRKSPTAQVPSLFE
jgi:hypothetical protein